MPIQKNWTPFNESFIQLIPPGTPGVYEIGNRYKDGVIRTIYIGSSGISLKERLLQHLQPSEPNICIKRYAQFFRFEVTSNPKDRERILLLEFRIINGGKLPLCNQSLP